MHGSYVKQRDRKRGFTLTELLIVIAIIAILLAIAIPFFSDMIKKAQDTACSANRRSAYGELNAERMLNSNADLNAILAKYQGTCPSGGRYSLVEDEDKVWIYCTKHGDDIVETLLYQFSDLAGNYASDEDYQKYLEKHGLKSYFNNDHFRRYLYDLNGGWPTLTYKGVTYYIQPYVEAGWSSATVFARTNGTSAAGWWAPLVYCNGTWYFGPSASINGKPPEKLEAWAQSKNWTALDPGDYVIEPPQ